MQNSNKKLQTNSMGCTLTFKRGGHGKQGGNNKGKYNLKGDFKERSLKLSPLVLRPDRF